MKKGDKFSSFSEPICIRYLCKQSDLNNGNGESPVNHDMCNKPKKRVFMNKHVLNAAAQLRDVGQRSDL